MIMSLTGMSWEENWTESNSQGQMVGLKDVEQGGLTYINAVVTNNRDLNQMSLLLFDYSSNIFKCGLYLVETVLYLMEF